MEVPDVNYAQSGDVSIAYQAVGEGPPDLVFLPFLANIYTLWQSPGGLAELLLRLATGRRLVAINPRGIGLSDRPRGFTVESRMDDVRAVMDDLGIERAALLGVAEQAATCAVFAASYPDRVEQLVLYNPWGRRSRDMGERDRELAQLRDDREKWGRRDFLEQLGSTINPQWADSPEYLNWFVWHHRLTASPASWIEFRRMQIDLDVTDVLPAIRIPTLVIAKEFMRSMGEEIAEAIPSCDFVVIPGRGGAIHENDYAIEAIEVFLAGADQPRVPDTVLTTVLFTDLVGSTARAAALGDRAWRDLLAEHHSLVRRELERFRGEERDTAGDGFFATFDGPARAIHAAEAIVGAVGELGLEIRAGVHTGECEVHEHKVAGLAVSIGARVAALAAPGEVLVSSTVKDLVAGSELGFEDRGTQELKGVPGEWRLFALSSA